MAKTWHTAHITLVPKSLFEEEELHIDGASSDRKECVLYIKGCEMIVVPVFWLLYSHTNVRGLCRSVLCWSVPFAHIHWCWCMLDGDLVELCQGIMGACVCKGVCACGGGGGGVGSIIHLNMACLSVRDGGVRWWSVLVFFLILKKKWSRVLDYKHLYADTFFLVLCVIAVLQKRLRKGRNLLQDDVQWTPGRVAWGLSLSPPPSSLSDIFLRITQLWR